MLAPCVANVKGNNKQELFYGFPDNNPIPSRKVGKLRVIPRSSIHWLEMKRSAEACPREGESSNADNIC